MNFKKLYYGLLGVLGGILLGVFVASPALDQEVFTSKQLQRELSVSVAGERVPSDKVVVGHSPRMNRILNLPHLVGGAMGIGLVFGFIVTVKEKRRRSRE